MRQGSFKNTLVEILGSLVIANEGKLTWLRVLRCCLLAFGVGGGGGGGRGGGGWGGGGGVCCINTSQRLNLIVNTQRPRTHTDTQRMRGKS